MHRTSRLYVTGRARPRTFRRLNGGRWDSARGGAVPRCGMVYPQRDSRALFLALPCRNCGCGTRAKKLDDALGSDSDKRCGSLKADMHL